MTETDIRPGDFVAYIRNPKKPDHIELGVVKSVRANGCFVAYNLGDTCAMTPWDHLVPIANGYATRGLVTRSEQLTGRTLDDIAPECETWGPVSL